MVRCLICNKELKYVNSSYCKFWWIELITGQRLLLTYFIRTELLKPLLEVKEIMGVI